MVTLNTTNIVGSASEVVWAQAQTINVDPEKQLHVVLRLSCADSDSLVDLVAVGTELLAEIEDKARQVRGLSGIQELVEAMVSQTADDLRLELMVALVEGEQMTIYGRGEVEAYLARGDQLALLARGEQMQAPISGKLQDRDKIVWATAELVKAIGLDKFKEILITEEKPAELLTPLLHMQSETSGIAALVGEVRVQVKTREWPKIKLNLISAEPRRINLVVAASILVLLSIMIGVGMVRRTRLLAEQDFMQLSTSVTTRIEEGLSASELNPEQARQLLSQARSEIEAYLETDARDQYKDRARMLLVELEQADLKAFKKNETKIETLVELSVLDEGLRSLKMKSDGRGNLVFVDLSRPKIVAMNLGDRSRQTIEVSDEKPVDIGLAETRVYALGNTGVREYGWKSNAGKQVIEGDDYWVEPKLLSTFAGNIYILDKGQSEIWKYSVLGDGFGARSRWLAPGITPDLSKVVDMKIEGDIWILTETGKIERYRRGAPTAFNMEGFPWQSEERRLSDPSALWVSDSLVYVLERGASRVVVMGIEGKYESQYTSPDFAKASDLVIVDDKGYVIVENVVKEFRL